MTDEEMRIKALEISLMYCAALPDSEKQRRWDDCVKTVSADKGYFDGFEDVFNMILLKLSNLDKLFIL